MPCAVGDAKHPGSVGTGKEHIMGRRCSFEFQEHKTSVANKEIPILSRAVGELLSYFCWC